VILEDQFSLTMIAESDIILNNKQKKTLERIFEDPVRSDVVWSDIENLFIALGAKITAGQGSRVRVILNDCYAVFHRPHPERVTDKGALKSVRRFLENAGVNKEGLL
jgi:hypothetical protein